MKTFVSKLSESVTNENLPVLNKLRIKIDTTNATLEDYYNKLSIRCTSDNTLKVLDGHNLYNMNGQSLGDTIALPARTTVNMRIVETGIYYIEVQDKYSITHLQLPETAVVDLLSLSYMEKLYSLSVKQNSVNHLTGNISYLPNSINNLEFICKTASVNGSTKKLHNMSLSEGLTLYKCGIEGDISELGTKTNNLSIRNTNIGGELEDFVKEKVVSAEQLSGTIAFNNLQTNRIMFKGILLSSSASLVWGQNLINNSYTDITYGSQSTTIVIDGQGNWSYVNNDKSKYTG